MTARAMITAALAGRRPVPRFERRTPDDGLGGGRIMVPVDPATYFHVLDRLGVLWVSEVAFS